MGLAWSGLWDREWGERGREGLEVRDVSVNMSGALPQSHRQQVTQYWRTPASHERFRSYYQPCSSQAQGKAQKDKKDLDVARIERATFSKQEFESMQN